MADIFLSEDVQKLLHNKFLVVIGDSGNVLCHFDRHCRFRWNFSKFGGVSDLTL